MKAILAIQDAKSMLPNMPDEVFDTWLLPIITNHSLWPYSNVFSLHPSEQWKHYFGLFTLHAISSCMWHKLPLTFASDTLDQISNKTIKYLIKSHVCGLDTSVHDSRNRFFGFVELIKNTGRIPAPIIGINVDCRLRVLDGNHRLAALTFLGLRGQIDCDTWVGGHPQ